MPNTVRIILRNTSGIPKSGQLIFRNSEGDPVEVSIGGVTDHVFQYSLAAWATDEFNLDGSGPLRTGTIEVQPDDGNVLNLEGTEVFDVFGRFVSVGAVKASPLAQVYVSLSTEETSGAALYNSHAEKPAFLDAAKNTQP